MNIGWKTWLWLAPSWVQFNSVQFSCRVFQQLSLRAECVSVRLSLVVYNIYITGLYREQSITLSVTRNIYSSTGWFRWHDGDNIRYPSVTTFRASYLCLCTVLGCGKARIFFCIKFFGWIQCEELKWKIRQGKESIECTQDDKGKEKQRNTTKHKQ